MHLSSLKKAVRTITHDEYREKRKISAGQAHKELFDTYCNYVYAIVFNRLRSCASREDIDECVCDVFADVYIYYDTSKDISGDISGFIGTVARRKAGAYYRRSTSSRYETVPIDDEETERIDPDTDVEDEIERKQLRRAVLDSISALGEPDSTIIVQKYYFGRSANEISGMVSLTPENVRVRSGRAVRKLKELLEKAGISI